MVCQTDTLIADNIAEKTSLSNVQDGNVATESRAQKSARVVVEPAASGIAENTLIVEPNKAIANKTTIVTAEIKESKPEVLRIDALNNSPSSTVDQEATITTKEKTVVLTNIVPANNQAIETSRKSVTQNETHILQDGTVFNSVGQNTTISVSSAVANKPVLSEVSQIENQLANEISQFTLHCKFLCCFILIRILKQNFLRD